MTDKAPDVISDPRPCDHGLVVDLCGCCIRDKRIADLQSKLAASESKCERLLGVVEKHRSHEDFLARLDKAMRDCVEGE